jgi:hypothetical protein
LVRLGDREQALGTAQGLHADRSQDGLTESRKMVGTSGSRNSPDPADLTTARDDFRGLDLLVPFYAPF